MNTAELTSVGGMEKLILAVSNFPNLNVYGHIHETSEKLCSENHVQAMVSLNVLKNKTDRNIPVRRFW